MSETRIIVIGGEDESLKRLEGTLTSDTEYYAPDHEKLTVLLDGEMDERTFRRDEVAFQGSPPKTRFSR